MNQKPKVAKLNQSEELKILRRIVEITNSKLDLESVLPEIVDTVSALSKADSVFIYLFDNKKKNLILKASKTSHQRDLGKIILKIGEGLTGWVAKEEEPVSIEKNAYQDARFKNFDVLPEDRYEAFLAVPILFQGNTIGVINLQHKSPHTYTQAIVNLIATIGKLVAGIIEQARLFEETRLKALQFESFMKVSESITSEQYLDEILNSIVQVTAELLNSKICSIMMLDDKGKKLLLKATQSLSEAYNAKPDIPLDNSLSGEVIRNKKPLAVIDVTQEAKYVLRDLAKKEGLSSMLLVPMIVKDEAIGIVNVYTKEPHEFQSEEVKALQFIANQAAVTIENARLKEESDSAKDALQTRKSVDRAKGVLMETQNLSEDAAYKWIRKKSMDSCRSMKEIADAIILTADLG